ncbi:dihydrolipoyl dehydrogenase [Hahella sp. CCB-MM4]|uniref:dihydrolipoyl dehydrogenase n=1 Tax=Hahella sp. (strain CCB-MM4) TaxID=1926491 RepID=UPI000B9A48E5|nr:dihydrolipoyl dehydrogenase [Hahella sp. CCB-MM4]OZG74958.1 dihydrolipoyl dehydrogenase [Hahella sp. CCB-MM4]
MNQKKAGLFVLVIALIGCFFIFDLGQYLSLEYFETQRGQIIAYTAANPMKAAALYFMIYVLVTGLSLPGAAVMTLIGGAIFGVFEGTILVSFASTLGATTAFLVSRLLLRDWVQNKFGESLRAVNQGIQREGSFYLFGMRLVPLFPFFVINLVMGLTPLKTRTFFWVSQLGMLPGTFVYVNAGTQLGQIESTSDILSPGLLGSFVLLGIFPFIAKRLMEFIKSRKVHYDRNLIVIGAGSAGLVTSYIATAVKANVTLIEKHKMGGDCLNTGCVPSKALLRSAKMAHYIDRAEEFGLKVDNSQVDFGAVMERVQSVVKQVEPHDSVERYTSLGVECIQGEATILDPFRVRVGDKVLTTRNIVIATGARPFVPPIPGVENVDYYTSDNIWDIRQKPEHLLILGGGPIGCELTQAFNRLGVKVTQVDMAPRLMPREDPDVSEIIERRFREEGIEVLVNHSAKEFRKTSDGKDFLICEHNGQSKEIHFDKVLLAVGRKANTDNLGLENIDLKPNPNGTLPVNEYLQTPVPNIYAAGDVAGPYQFTHTAAHQAWYAAVNSLFGGFKKFKADYRVIPWATFTDPEVARVGLSEEEAKQQGIQYEVTRFGIDDLDRAIADNEAHGFIKVLTVPGKDKVLGATIVGYHAGELITEYISAMKHGIGLNKILGTIHIYPTLSETNKYAAGEWKRAHAPNKVLEWLAKWHRWQLGKKTSKPELGQSGEALK